MSHNIPIRIYYEDTDAGGVVYYANYLKYAERGRTELLRSLGVENKALLDTKGLGFVVRHIEADYFKPAVLDDNLELRTEVIKLKNASVVMKQSLFRQNDLLFSCTVTLACINIAEQKPEKFPDGLKDQFKTFLTA